MSRWAQVAAILLILFGAVQSLPAQVTSNVLLRVRMIRAGASIGSSFTLDIEGRQYLVTAKHLVTNLKSEDTVDLYKHDRWAATKVKVFRCADPVDIAVLVLPAQETVAFPLGTPTPETHFFMGQDAYFAGFPYGQFSAGKGTSGVAPIPFIKKGVISAMTYQGDAHLIFLDGHNNPGFSGGPIVYQNMNSRQPDFRVVAVISGFRHDYNTILNTKVLAPGESAPLGIIERNGKKYRLIESDSVVRANTGIVLAYDIKHAIELIQQHPIGPKISEDFKPQD